jgi:TolB protein
MSDELIEGRSLRGRLPEPGGEQRRRSMQPPAIYPPGAVPRFLTSTGELQPITEETIAEIEAALDAHARGEGPPGYVPRYEDPAGALRPLTPETFEDVIAYARQRSWRRVPPSRRGKRVRDVPSEEPAAGEPQPPLPEDFIPWFERTADLPPIVVPDEEIEILPDEAAEGRPAAPPARPARRAPREHGPVTRQLLAAIRGEIEEPLEVRPRRWGAGRIALLLAGVAVAVLLIFAPLRLRDLIAPPASETPPAGTPPGTALPSEGGAALAETPQPGGVTSTPQPYAQGRIAFASNRDGDFEIYVLDLRTGTLAQLTDNDRSDHAPAWSPDGTRIVFVSDRDGDDDLWVMGTDGMDQVQLTGSTAMDRAPAWSPDGSMLVFARETVNGSDLLVMPAACLDEPQTCEDAVAPLTGGRYDLDPAWSPDGTRIAFAASDFPGLPAVIALIEPDGEGYRPLEGTGASDITPVWSPDGTRIAFASFAQGDNDLYVMASDGTGLIQLTADPSSDIQPEWSPDGLYVVFASDRGGADFELVVMRATCAEPDQGCEADLVPLTDNEADDLDPAWLP